MREDPSCGTVGCPGCDLPNGCERCGRDIHVIFRICEWCAERELYEEQRTAKPKGPIVRRKTA